MDQAFYSTLVELAKIGSAGVGVAVLLMVFIMIIRAKPVDPDTAKLRENFLKLGVGFAIIVGLFALIPTFLHGGPLAMRLTFSPDFKTESLTPPTIMLPDGSEVKPDQPLALPPSTGTQVLKVTIDQALKEVANLRQASAKLAESVSQVQQQRDALASQAAPAAAAPATQTLSQQSQQTEQLQTQVAKSIQVGDFERANALSAQLHASVVNSRPAVAAIARAQH